MNLSHENKFLLACIQSKNADDLLNNVKNIPMTRLNWDDVLASAYWHGIAALLCSHLNGMQENVAVPENVMAGLRSAYYENIARNTYLYAELTRILEAFQKESVEVILLKGLALVKTVYKDLGVRKIGDIDLLVKGGDLSQAENIMAGLGYLYPENKNPEWSREKEHHLNYEHPEKNIPVEIHWHISHKSHPGQMYINNDKIITQFWEQALTAKIGDREVKMLCPEDLLMHLCHHFMKHRFLTKSGFNGCFTSRGALMQLYDMVRVLECNGDDIEWGKFQRDAKEFGLDGLTYSTLALIKEVFPDTDEVQKAFNQITAAEPDHDIVRLLLKKLFLREDSDKGVNSFLIKLFGENTFLKGCRKTSRYLFSTGNDFERLTVSMTYGK